TCRGPPEPPGTWRAEQPARAREMRFFPGIGAPDERIRTAHVAPAHDKRAISRPFVTARNAQVGANALLKILSQRRARPGRTSLLEMTGCRPCATASQPTDLFCSAAE